MNRRTQGLLAIYLAALIFGSAAMFGKLMISPLRIVATRAGFDTIVLLRHESPSAL